MSVRKGCRWSGLHTAEVLQVKRQTMGSCSLKEVESSDDEEVFLPSALGLNLQDNASHVVCFN